MLCVNALLTVLLYSSDVVAGSCLEVSVPPSPTPVTPKFGARRVKRPG